MTTKIFDVTVLTGDALARIDEAASIIRRGGLVAFPTETVYGLGANALDEAAVRKIYEAKGRPADNPTIVHIARASDLERLAKRVSEPVVRLADSFWPGPLTVVLTKREEVPGVTTGGLDTVAVRLPEEAVAAELIRRADCPIAAPSANISGKPSPTTALHVIDDLSGKIDAVLAGNACRIGIESTVLDMSGEVPTILRPGIITAEQIGAALGAEVMLDPALRGNSPENIAKPKAPGMKYRHYAPKAEMLVIEVRQDRVRAEVGRLKTLNEQLGRKVGVLLFEEQNFVEAAHDFFAELRDLDKLDVDLILAGALSYKDGVGFVVMNRMMKAAGYNIVKV